jgi:hypothetical protein
VYGLIQQEGKKGEEEEDEERRKKKEEGKRRREGSASASKAHRVDKNTGCSVICCGEEDHGRRREGREG